MDRVKLNDLKKELLLAAAETERSGLCRSGTGNLSLIDRGEGYIIITPSGVPKISLEAQDLIVCGPDGGVLENPIGRKPSRELLMHLGCYRKRRDINSVVHTHSAFASAFASVGEEIPPVLTEADFYGRNTKCVAYEKPGSVELAEKVESALEEDTDVLLLEKHGVLAVGSNVADALLKAVYAEEVAKVAFLSKLIK